MPLASGNGPRWIRRQKVASERAFSGIAPIRRFLAALFGRRATSATARPGPPDDRGRHPRP